MSVKSCPNSPINLILRSAANSLKNSNTPLGAYFRKIQAKKGYLHAIVATANKLARIIYTMVKNKSEFDDTKGYNEKEILEKRLAKAKRTVEVLQKQLNVA